MALRINDTVPDFTAETDQGTIKFHDWIGDNWAILFSHPKDCLLYTSPSPRDRTRSRMPSSA